jgi:hypothetical protein
VGGEEVWAKPECPAFAPALVCPGQEDEALLRGALVSRYKEFLIQLGENLHNFNNGKKSYAYDWNCNLSIYQ